MIRFGQTAPPSPGGNPGGYEERVAQWFLEGTFFRDFVHRNPAGKGGSGELADALVLYGDVVLMVQVKAQVSKRDPIAWVRKHIGKAASQLRGTDRMLSEGHVPELHSETLGSVPFDPNKYKYKHGLILVAHESQPYDPVDLCGELLTFSFPVHVLSLADFIWLSQRMDTAGDLISYLDRRYELRAELPMIVHREVETARGMRQGNERLLIEGGCDPDIARATAEEFDRQLQGELQGSTDYQYSVLVDDIIAHLHTRDPSLPWNDGTSARDVAEIAEHLAWLPRRKRITVGQHLFLIVEKARDGEDHVYDCLVKSRRIVFVFLATSRPREDRIDVLRRFVVAIRVKYDAPTGIGVATNPAGWGGRAYDVLLHTGDIAPEVRAALAGVFED